MRSPDSIIHPVLYTEDGVWLSWLYKLPEQLILKTVIEYRLKYHTTSQARKFLQKSITKVFVHIGQ